MKHADTIEEFEASVKEEISNLEKELDRPNKADVRFKVGKLTVLKDTLSIIQNIKHQEYEKI